MRLRILFLLLVFLTSAAWAADSDPKRAVRLALQNELQDFSDPEWEKKPFTPGPAFTEYRARLLKITGGESWPGEQRAGSIPLVRAGHPTELLGVNVFRPEGPSAGTLLFVHGYLSHSGNFAYTTAFFLKRNWTVVTLDLPGHGLSTGARGDVDSFEEYGDAVETWLTWVEKTWPGPKVLLAHSLGTAACLEALRRHRVPVPARVVFCAPLLRTDWYPALAFGQATLGWFMKEVPSTMGWDGYLDGYSMPTHWFAELGRWLDALKNQGPLDLPLTIYSGDKDDVVAEDWNRAEYQRLVPGARYVVLPGKGHLFLTETRDRQAFHEQLATDLGLTPLPQQD